MRTPFSIGCTSCVYPDTAYENVRKIAAAVDDIELMFFENPREDNFPGDDELRAIGTHLQKERTSCTIHLPTEHIEKLLSGDVAAYAEPALQVIEKCSLLSPYAYVLHVADDGVLFTEAERHEWLKNSTTLIRTLQEAVSSPSAICIENLYYPFAYNRELVHLTGCSYALDLGHLWAAGVTDWEAIVRDNCAQISVMHLHGYNTRDHESLTFVNQKRLVTLYKILLEIHYAGIVTCEVFGEKATLSSLQIVKELWAK